MGVVIEKPECIMDSFKSTLTCEINKEKITCSARNHLNDVNRRFQFQFFAIESNTEAYLQDHFNLYPRNRDTNEWLNRKIELENKGVHFLIGKKQGTNQNGIEIVDSECFRGLRRLFSRSTRKKILISDNSSFKSKSMRVNTIGNVLIIS